MVLQQAEPTEMDRLGEAAEEAARQVWAGAHRLLWSRVLHTQCHPTATGDYKVTGKVSTKPPTLLVCFRNIGHIGQFIT